MGAEKSKLSIKLGICAISFTLMVRAVISLTLVGISQETGASTVAVQMVFTLVTFAGLFTVFVAGPFARSFSKKKILIIMEFVLFVGGMVAYFFGSTIGMIYVSSIIIGFAGSMLATVSRAIITESFQDNTERAKVFGFQMIMQSLGSIIALSIAGNLAAIYWRNTYLTFAIALVAMALAIFLLPEGPLENATEGQKVKVFTPALVKFVLYTLFFGIIYMTFSSNVAFLMQEIGAGNESLAGYLSSILMGVTFVAGLLLSKVMKIINKQAIAICFGMCAIGLLIVAFGHNIILVVIGAVILGFFSGVFTPAVFMEIPHSVDPSAVTASMAYVNAAAGLGMFLNPYVVTIPASMLNIAQPVASRFIVAAIYCIALTLIAYFVKRSELTKEIA